ncbi:MAG: branched-chain amino acid ABC transporter substrate-binding protein [Chloroflexi bacterium]|nr:MAG: branched-chain amino acid ABC transporter substrate-binding protein [Chloroflexota bacterium]HDN79745.1 ABC transporter substrate-binding protein [Chloroflexota bacterium]
MGKKVGILLLALILLLSACKPAPKAAYGGVIKIGHVAPLTGDIPKVGEEGKYALELWLEDIEKAGGIEVGGVKYKVEIIHEDNESKAESAAAATTKLITEDKVLAIIGAYASKQAIPAGEVADSLKTPMISPWSTNPRTTKNRPWVFRACFLDDFQGRVLAKFVKEEFGAKKVAVLYDIASDYPKGLAEFFKKGCEEVGLEVVAFESFTTKDRDFSAQLTKIKESGAEVLMTPQYYDEVPLIVKQAHELGLPQIIVGSDSWGSPELMKLCGDDCVGYYFSTHWAVAGAKGAAKEFIDRFQAKYGYAPGDCAALAWDSAHILQQAIESLDKLTGDLETDRKAIRDAIASIKEYPGITGKMSFTEQGDPIKCAVIVRINEKHEFEFYKMACP